MKYFMDLEILYEKMFVISKYCPILNSSVNTFVTDMSNVELSTDSDSRNNIYNNNITNNIVNNSRIRA